MSKRDSLYTHTDMVEYDECYVGVTTKKQVKEKLKRVKGSQRKAFYAVSPQSIPLEELSFGESSRFCGYYKMEV